MQQVNLGSNAMLQPTKDVVQAPQRIFDQDIVLPAVNYALPVAASNISSTPQLAYCLSLLRSSSVSEVELDWLQTKVSDLDEQNRFKTLSTDLIRAFVRDELKKAEVVAEVVCLAAVLDQDDFSALLKAFVNGIEQSVLLKVHLIDGLAQLVRNAAPGYIDTDDLVKVLELLDTRLNETHEQSTEHIYRLTSALSRVLDSMVDAQVKGLKREQLHEPLSAYLKKLQDSSDPSLVYQAAYGYQALQYIPDDETILQARVRRTRKIISGISGVVSAVKAIDLNHFIEGLQSIQGGLAGANSAIGLLYDAYDNAKALAESGQGLLQSLKEGFSFSRKSAWYPALRGLDILLQEGKLVEFEKLIREAPCRKDVAFHWGVCQRLGEIAFSPLWGANARQRAIAFLEELYKDESVWGQQAHIKLLILQILTQLADSSDNVASQARKLLGELETNVDTVEQALPQDSPKEYSEYSSRYPFMVSLAPQTSPLLACVQNKSDLETPLRKLKRDRTNGRSKDVYISPRAKANLRATEDFDLNSKVQEFLESNKKVFLLLGDSGAGKSTFNRTLEIHLWDKYENVDGRIPVFVHLPTIDKPEYDLIAKQLRRANFTEEQIQELKASREFILICDGYDESQQTRNLYTSNQLNQTGGWRARMIISCRTEYIGVDYKESFQPTDKDHGSLPELFQEAVITPFNKDQIRDYINQYITLCKPSWEPEDYQRALKEIPNLQDLVKNPFLLKLALEVLPQLVDRASDFSLARVTRVGLYDEFVAQWLERGKVRLMDVELSPDDKEAFKTLSASGFKQHGTTYLKELTTAIYDNQNGKPVFSYVEPGDLRTWKEAFFGREDGKNLLLEAMPLICSGNQYWFIHRSVLEYGLTLAVFDPSEQGERDDEPTLSVSRRGSAASILSFEAPSLAEDSADSADSARQALLDSPLGRRNFVKERSILQFLVERVQQQPGFKVQLHAVIEESKTDKKWRIAAANAITLLVKAGVQFNQADLRDINIPGADISNGVFDSAQLQGSDLRKVNLQNAWLRQADLSGAQLSGVLFGELPYLKENSSIESCAYSPDGSKFAVGLADGDISLYETLNWSKVGELKGHTKDVCCLAFSVTSDRLASGSNDMTVRLWDTDTFNCIHTFEGHRSNVASVAYSPKGDQLASGSDDKTLKLWNVENGNCIHTLLGHIGEVVTVQYSPDGDQVVSGSKDKLVKLWDVGTGNCIQSLKGHSGAIARVLYSPKGDHFISASLDCTLRLWDAGTGGCVHILRGHGSSVISVAYSPKGNQIASGSWDNTVRMWDIETGACVHTLEGHSDWVHTVAYSSKGDRIASGSDDFTVRLWDVESGSCIQTLQGQNLKVTSVLYSPDGNQIASGSSDKTVRLWDVKTINYVQTPHGHDNCVVSVRYSPNGCQIASGSDDCTVRLWDVETGNCVKTLEHSQRVASIAYSPKGNELVSGSWDWKVRLWDVETGNCAHILQGHGDSVRCVLYSPRGDQVASGSDDSTVRLWDVETGECIHILEGHEGYVNCIAYSPNGDQIASASDDYTVMLWDVKTGEWLRSFEGHDKEVTSVYFSPAGSHIASASWDRAVRLWNVETAECVHTLEAQGEDVSKELSVIAYSPKGNQVASASEDGTVRLWDVDTGDCIHALEGHEGSMVCIEYSPLGDRIASGGYDGTLRLWSVETGECLVVISGFNGAVVCVAWEDTSHGQYLLTGSEDKSVRRWQITKEQDEYRALLSWSSSHDGLTAAGATFHDLNDLGEVNRALLCQRGALITPSSAQ
ncbi:hypothetical protein BGZ80_006045 [Entomortierella chlamydospora]|uniref:Arm-like repeat domain-containing protein n=1 Tax=Entomortierella chlamydospora TaxID=101097 RepID=A0A9P6MZQ5_9FUNG|nr:hypothetical protein BGZ80_006045 [Entomortierella chlamydospora]